MKVCPHCAEELPDEAMVCPHCHTDPATAPASAAPRLPDEPEAWSFEEAREATAPASANDRSDSGHGRIDPGLDLAPLYEAVLRTLVARFVFHRNPWNVMPWNALQDDELAVVDEAFVDPAPDEDARAEAAIRRSEKLRAIGSLATFSSGVARIDGEFRSVGVAVTLEDFVLLDNWTHLDPETDLARLPRDTIADAVVVDENGDEVADALVDPICELDSPAEARYAVVLRRCGPSGALQPVSFLFRSGEPALECRDRYRRFIRPPDSPPLPGAA
jgi:hypothetical protein